MRHDLSVGVSELKNGSKSPGVNSPTLPFDSIANELGKAGTRRLTLQAEKKNYAETLSRQLAQRFADLLRSDFDGVLPDANGRRHESRARSAKGVKKLDVNYSTPELGLGLGLSVKTINFPDGATKRYTKNYTRVDAELRAEASDYHVRQPYAVLIAVVFLPADACNDGVRDPSSFGQAVKAFRFRSGRLEPEEDPNLFERVFIGLYETSESAFGSVGFFDVHEPPPKHGLPGKLMGFDGLLEEIRRTYDLRNSPVFEWADAAPEAVVDPVVEVEDDGD
jgi:hypothetical protein